ncbi:MAG: rRNA (guanine527-N7)-methyltransferase [Chloroflexota bacterium]|nr:rRNA (guanine527-N7)-methyltransferase [Chloroflexota bacterium]
MEGPREPLPTRVDDTPVLPAGYDAALDAGLAALGSTLTVSARAAIDGHARLLLAWNRAINLTAIRDPEAVALAHVVDSLTALSVLAQRGIDRYVDLGSGGGYPGLPIAAALPAARALLIEPVGKKAAFLSVAIAATGLAQTVEAAAIRAEALAGDARHRGRWAAVTVRAVAGLGELIELAFPLLEPGGCLVAWKRGDIAGELIAAERAIAALGGGDLEVRPIAVPGLDRHCLVVATARGGVPATYPRDPAARKRRPW